MASWLKSAEELLQAVDKTAKAVHSVAKQQGPGTAAQTILQPLTGASRSRNASSQRLTDPDLVAGVTDDVASSSAAYPDQQQQQPEQQASKTSFPSTNTTFQGVSRSDDALNKQPGGAATALNRSNGTATKGPAGGSRPPSRPTSARSSLDVSKQPPVSAPSAAKAVLSGMPDAGAVGGKVQAPQEAKTEAEESNVCGVAPAAAAAAVDSQIINTVDQAPAASSEHTAGGVDAASGASTALHEASSGVLASLVPEGESLPNVTAALNRPESFSNITKEQSEEQQIGVSGSGEAARLVAEAVAAASAAAEAALDAKSSSGSQTNSAAAAAVVGNEATTGSASVDGGEGVSESKEARLSRAVDVLRKKVKRLEEENQQLEDMLAQADAQAQGGSGEISRLEDALAREQAAKISAQAALNTVTAAKDVEIQGLRDDIVSCKAELDVVRQRLEEVESSNETMTAERKASESALITAIRQEVESVEAQLQEERSAHAASRRASAAREQQLDASLAEAAEALANLQRHLDERTARVAAIEERCAALESENETLHHTLAQSEAKVQLAEQAIDPKTASAAAAAVTELEEALAKSKTRIGDLEAAAVAAATETASLKDEVIALRREVADARSMDAADLKRRLQEASDALYLKQTQLERANAEAAANRLALERQLAAARTEAQQVRRRASASDRALIAAEDGVVPTDAVLGDAYAHLERAGRVGGAVVAGVKLLDDSASMTMRVLRRSPLARLMVVVYVLFIHAFCYALLHRLQHRAFHAMELAAEMELDAGNASLH